MKEGYIVEKIFIPQALPPAGHYTPAIKAGNFVYISGQLPVDPLTGAQCHEHISVQTKLVLANMEALVRAAGGSKTDVIKVTVYIPEIQAWDAVNKVYQEFFGEHKPTRTIVPTGELHYGFKIELEAVAYIK